MDNVCPECQHVFCIDHIFGTKCKSVDSNDKMTANDKFFLNDSCGMIKEDIATFSSIKSITIYSLLKLGNAGNKLKHAHILAIIKKIKHHYNHPCVQGTKVDA